MDIEAETGTILLQLFLTKIHETSLVFILLNIFVLLLLLGLSAIVSGLEAAIFLLSDEEKKRLRESEKKRDKIIAYLLIRYKKLTASLLIFNKLINLSFVSLACYLCWSLLGSKSIDGISLFLLIFLVLILMLVIGELFPRFYASKHHIFLIRRSVFLARAVFFVFKPFSFLFIRLDDIIEKRIEKKGYKIQLEELPEFIDEIPIDSTTTEKEKQILKGIANFGSTTVKEIMISRMDISAVDIQTPFHELLDEIRRIGYSRVPAYKDTVDTIEGVLYVRDLLPFIHETGNFEWTGYLRSTYFVPQNKKIDVLLKDFQDKRTHMAIVVDEYGGTAGLVTMEDVIEEIVGEIRDEFDEITEKLYTQVDKITFLFEGKIPLNDFCKIMDVDTEVFEDVKGESQSLGGLLLEIFSRFPKLNEELYFDKFLFTVVSLSARRIKIIKVKVLE